MRKLIAGILGGLAVVAIIGLYMYNKPHKNMNRVTPEYTLMANELSDQYSTDEDAANKKYLGKVIQVKGAVLSDKNASEQRIIMLKGSDLANIQCSLPLDDNAKTPFQKGEIVSIKGACTGMLLDVIMNDCVIVKQK